MILLVAWILPYLPWTSTLWFELYARSPETFPGVLRIPLETRELRPPREGVARALWGVLLPRDTASPGAGVWLRGARDTVAWGMGEGWLALPSGDFHLSFHARVVRSDAPRIYPAKLWKSDLSGEQGLSGDLITGAASYTRGPLSFLLGRSPLVLGGDLESALLLGPAAPPYDMVFASYTYRAFRGFFAVSGLDGWRLGPEDTVYYGGLRVGDIYRRYLSVHGLEYTGSRFRVRLSEIVLYTGKDRPPEAYYLNPFYFFLAGHFNRGGLDNISWDLTVHAWFPRTLFFGELYIDDAQYETPPTREPDQLAWTVGLLHYRGLWSFLLRYTRVNAWTYLHEGSFQNWVYLRFPMGHPLGPDVEEILVGASRTAEGFRLEGRVWVRNKGENTLSTPWPVYPGGWSAFPSGSHMMWGVVERRVGVGVSALFWRERFFGGGEVQLEDVRNARHLPGVRDRDVRLAFHAGVRLP